MTLHPYTAALVRQNMRQRQLAGFPVASTTGGKIAEGAGLGAVAGALAGAAVGSAMGRVGLGAAIGGGGGALIGGIIGAKSGASSSVPAGCTVLVAEQMAGITISIAASQAITYCPPGGGTIQSATSADPTVASASVISSQVLINLGSSASAGGTTTVTVSWTDSSGTQWTSTIPVTITT